MKNFLAGEWRKEHALKRGGDVHVLSLDFDSAEEFYVREPSHDLSPEAIYERRWALATLQRAMSDLQERYAADGNAELFDALKGSVGGEAELLPYAELAQRLGRSEGALRTAASRLRSRWRQRLRELVADTVRDDAEVSGELQRLAGSVDSGV
jgi:DNA-directed RNA polymerase specialized sigma24 family protein